jgi:hypothetical protein
MADLYTTDLGGNSRKAQPSSLFGTRDLVFISLSLYEYDLYTDSPSENSNASKTYKTKIKSGVRGNMKQTKSKGDIISVNKLKKEKSILGAIGISSHNCLINSG